jgi:hypothetical protein
VLEVVNFKLNKDKTMTTVMKEASLILNLRKWTDRITNDEVFQRAKEERLLLKIKKKN